ncbi:pseudouridine synthase family protein [Halobacteroides halobius DSM 5150]|uniref:Pseudouridine synthase n=1 Tax=Halobacteroides halobius (strain ATCC 35273 / DSM 5150 / MD-1) TaxID=748449 RepID=L0K6D7_HALHC|nr:pseudouridine synthase [Halobacteroides halobius]AGB40591.1 pseudouridine synthase family protein [Halobacteroides halobius DSM 5150]
MERLQKIMAQAGVASRRKSEEIIKEGRVEVNGEVVTQLGAKVDPSQDKIKVDGEELELEKAVYILLNKPKDVITTVDDPQGRKTVVDMIDVKQRIYPVGRLDYDTEGLLLLTNDGDVTYALTHPSHQVGKKYIATVEGTPSENALERLEAGVELADGLTAPAQADLVVEMGTQSILSLEVHEGRKHQVKRMCEKVGHPVKELKRIKVGPLNLDEELKPGEYRHLTAEEVAKLQEIVKQVKENE